MPGLNYSTSPNLELVKTALDELRDNTLLEQTTNGKAEATDALVFSQSAVDRAAWVSSVIGGGGYFKKTITGTAQDITSKKVAAKNAFSPKTTIIAEFNQDVPISRSFMMDQQHEAVAKSIRQQTLAWTASRDQNAFGYYAYGFGTTLSSTIGDAVALFSNSHVNANGDTVDNYETGLMSDANLNTVIVSLRAQKNQGGVIVGYEPKLLLAGSTLDHDARIVAKSVLRAGTGQNDLNYFSELYPGMKVCWNQFIDNSGATNQTTMYFVGAAQHGVVRFEREAFFSTLVPWETDPNDLYKYKLRAREEVDTIEYAGLVGSDGSTA
jgi:hypothetical protein